MATYGWNAAKVGEYPSALEAETQDGTGIIVRANVKVTSKKQGLTNVHVKTASGKWTSVAMSPDGSLLDVAVGGTLDQNQERLNEGRKTRRAA